jgi:hypothetical protein
MEDVDSAFAKLCLLLEGLFFLVENGFVGRVNAITVDDGCWHSNIPMTTSTVAIHRDGDDDDDNDQNDEHLLADDVFEVFLMMIVLMLLKALN